MSDSDAFRLHVVFAYDLEFASDEIVPSVEARSRAARIATLLPEGAYVELVPADMSERVEGSGS